MTTIYKLISLPALFIALLTLTAFAQAPSITSFTPSSGAIGTSVTITGTNFNTAADNNVVFFGAVRATVTAATTTSLTVVVPAGASYGPITELNTHTQLAAYSKQFFTPVFSPVGDGIRTSDFSPSVSYSTGSTPVSVAIGDLDGDNKPDLAVANSAGNTVSVLLNTGRGFAAKADYTTGASPSSLAIGDIDGDGKPDIVTANITNSNVSVLRNTSSIGSISFADRINFSTGTFPNSVAIQDFDGDGKPDLATANTGANTVSVLRNTSTTSAISFAENVDFATGTGNSAPRSIAVGDLNSDGKPDLVTANSMDASVSAMHNKCSPGVIDFGKFRRSVTGALPHSIIVGDIDGDGKFDVVTANTNGNTISVLRNITTTNAITLAEKVDFTVGEVPESVSISDLDGDGKPDLAVANFGGNSVSVLRNTSSGSGNVSFASKADITTGGKPYSIITSDLDGDGKPELITPGYNSSNISVAHNGPVFTTVESIERADKETVNTTTVDYTVTFGTVGFGASLSGLSVSSFSLTTTGTVSEASVFEISGTGSQYTVTVHTGSGDGTIALNLNNTIGLSAGISTSIPFSGQTYLIDKTAPSVSGVAVPVDGTYKLNEHLDFTVSFGEAITVTSEDGIPYIDLTLTTGGTVRANYVSGSESTALTFRYVVSNGNEDKDGVTLGTIINANGGYLRDSAGNDAILTLNSIAPTLGILVNARTPLITSLTPDKGAVGSLISISGADFSDQAAVTIGGTPSVVISNTGSALVVMVMPGTSNGTASVTTAGGTATSTASFTVASSALPNSQQGTKLAGDGTGSIPRRGGSVSISADGNTAIAGENSGAWIYTRSGTIWTKQAAQLVGDNVVGSITAAAVSISADGNTAMIGGYFDGSGKGAIWFFARNVSTNVWAQQGSKMVVSGAGSRTEFGTRVALSADGNTAIAGAIDGTAANGAIYIFKRSNGTWTQQSEKLVGTGGVKSGQFGPKLGMALALSADGNIAVAGGPNDNGGIGAVWVFTRTGDTWAQQGEKLVVTDYTIKPSFGNAISLSADGKTMIIGGGSETGGGAAWIFTRTGETWTQQGAKLTGIGIVGNANYGNAVSISADGNAAIVGAPQDNTVSNKNQGAVWLYSRNSLGVWTQQGDKKTDSGGALDAQFGGFVALSADGSTAIVGGPKDNNQKGSVWFFAAAPPPTITSFNPASAVTGSVLTISGTNFSGATAVSIGGMPAASFTVVSATSITAVVGAGSNGEVTVTTPGGTVRLAGFTVPAPVITYGTAQTYTAGTAISTLTSSNSGGAVPATVYGSISDLGSGFVSPQHVVVDASGNLYIADFGNSAIKKIAASDGSVTSLGSGFSVPTGVAVDGSGNVYVADFGNNAIKKIAADDGAVTVLLSGIVRPRNVAVDALGNVYVADPENSAVKKIAASDGSVSSIGSGFNKPYGIVTDASGNIYVADWNHSAIKKIDTHGTITELGSNFSHPFNVDIDALGNLYVADNGEYTVSKIAASDGSITTIGSGFDTPLGVAVDGSGNVYVADQGSRTIKKVIATGYEISPALPAGLSFDATTGAISGTPTTPSPAANYTVTAHNAGGSGSAVVSITVDYAPPTTQASSLSFSDTAPSTSTLSWIIGNGSSRAVFLAALSTGSPLPADKTTYIPNAAFGSGTEIGGTGWYCVYNGTGSSVTITGLSPKTGYRVMVVEYNGTTGSEKYILTTGEVNPVNVTTLSNHADLAALALSTGTLEPAFAGGTLGYTATVSHAKTSLTITPAAADETAAITVNGLTINSGSASEAIVLNVGPNTITTAVTAQDGTTKTYTVLVTRAPSANADLAALVLSAGNLNPAFDAGTQSYAAAVSHATASITLTPTLADTKASLTVNGTALISGSASGGIALKVGVNTITTAVTAQDGTTTKTYTVVVTRAPSANADLASLTLSAGNLNPAFDAGTLGYTATVSNATASLTITPATADEAAVITVNGVAVTSGSASGGIALNVGVNTITTLITAANGSTKSYTLTVTRAPSANADLSVISLSNGTLDPVFNPGTFSYTTNVNNLINIISIRPFTSEAGATVKVNGMQVVSGSESGNIALSTGSNLITIAVTSGDGSTTRTYSVKVNRLSTWQVLPDSSGDASVTNNAAQVVATSPTQPVSITVPPGTTDIPSIAYLGLVDQGIGTLPQTVVNSTFAQMTIPAATQVRASNPAWDGVLHMPAITTYDLPAIPGQTITPALIIEVGSPDFSLSFDKAVRLQLAGQAGMRIARVHNSVYSEILLTGPEDSQAAGDALAHDGSFKINVGNDAVVWTKVFSKFITFSQTTDLNVALVEADKTELSPDLIKAKNASLSSVTSPLLLPVSGSFGSAISWVSSNPALVSANGQTIVRPVFGSGNINVILTATISKGLITETKSFNVIVSQLPNQAPTLAAIANVAICSTTELQTLTLAGITGGPESGQTTGLSVRSNKPAMFSELLIDNGLLKYRLNPGATATADITLTVKDNGGTADGGIDTLSRTFTLTVNALPASAISSNLGNQISKGLTAVLSVSPVTGSTYSWTNAAGIIAGQNTSSLSVRPALTTTYTLTITSSTGCVALENYTITVIEDLKTLTINNLLTPNGDGTNDLLVIKNLDMYPGNVLKIFDRAGREIFRKVNYQNDWDGTYQGSPLAEGTYFYIVGFGPGKPMLKGYVSIVR